MIFGQIVSKAKDLLIVLEMNKMKKIKKEFSRKIKLSKKNA